VTDVSTRLQVTVRYFAAARAAAGSDDETLYIEPGATVSDLVDIIGDRNARLATVLARCSYLCDGVAVRNAAMSLQSGQTVDVLPPFAGG
jgi:molybdopterin converting factor small subunit